MSGTALIYMEFQDLKLKYPLSASHLTSVNSLRTILGRYTTAWGIHSYAG